MWIKTVLITILFAAGLFAASNIDETAGAWNGRAWAKMSRPMRLEYLRGAFEGDGLCQVTAKAPSRWPNSLTLGEIAKAVDSFYKEPTNAPVPILFGAVIYVNRKVEGASDAELQRLAAELRLRSR